MKRFIAPWIICLLAVTAMVPPAPSFAGFAAQPAVPDDDDDADDDAEEAVPDPDQAPDADAGDDDAEPVPEAGDDAAGGDDGAAADDTAAASEGSDATSDDDDSTTSAAAGGTGDDASVAEPGGDDDGVTDDGDDDPVDTASGADDDSDDDDSDAPAAQYAGLEDARTRERNDREEDIDSDDDGFRYRRGEFVALGVDDRDLARLTAAGFRVKERHRLSALNGEAVLLSGPARMKDDDALDQVDDLIDDAAHAFNHLFDRTAALVRPAGKAERVSRRACPCRIGVIDTGVAGTLPDLKRTRLIQQGFNGGTPDPALHGTIISSLIAGTEPTPGTRTEIIVADVFSGPRRTAGSALAVVRALDWMAAQKVAVINVSLAGANNPVVADAIKRLTARGHIIVAAAGNDGPAAPPAFPAAYPGVIAVTAVDAAQNVYRYANRGAYVAFAARGVDVVGLGPDGQPRAVTGTSFAAPSVAIRLASTLKTPDPAAARAAITSLEREARDLGAPGRDTIFGAGLIGDRP